MKIKKILFLLLIYFMGIILVNAAEISFEKNSAIINEKESIDINLVLKIAEEETIENISFELGYNSELIKFNKTQEVDTYGYARSINGNNIVIVRVEDIKDFADGIFATVNFTNIASEDVDTELLIQNIKIKLSDDTTINLADISMKLYLKKQVTTTTRALNTSAKLTNISISNATMKPAFSKDVYEYKIYVNKDTIKQITIKPIYEQDNVSMETECILGCVVDAKSNNKLNLIMGKNQAVFTFTSEDGKETKEYKFTIYRGETTDGSVFLSNITVDNYTLNELFEKTKLDYTLTVPYETENLVIKAIGEDENAVIQIKGSENLVVGENVITITVNSSENDDKKIYNVTVTREEYKPSEVITTVTAPKIEKEVKNTNWKLIIILAIISCLIIGLSAYFIFFSNGKKKKKKTDVDAISVKEYELPRTIAEEKEPTSVDDALKDLMATKELERADEQ